MADVTTDGKPSLGAVQRVVTDKKHGAFTYGQAPSTPPATPTGPTGPAPLSAAQNGALAYLRNILAEYGLEDLTEWAADELRKGYEDVVVLQHLREQPLFKERFKVIFDRQEKGLPAISPAQVIEYERTAAQLMGRFGVPRGFYDNQEDFHDLLMRDVSPAELQARLEQGYGRVLAAPVEVRSVFKEFFGVEGDKALATFFLDPDKAQPVLERQLAAALDAGAAKRYGWNLDYGIADRLASVGITEDEAAKGFLQLNSQRGLFAENFGESDITAEDTGVKATFGLDAEAQRTVDRRVQSRQAAFSGDGGTLTTQEGARGAGVAGQ